MDIKNLKAGLKVGRDNLADNLETRRRNNAPDIAFVAGQLEERDIIIEIVDKVDDLLTEEQQKLEKLRGLIAELTIIPDRETDYANSDYRNGYITGSNVERGVLLSMFAEVLNK